MVGGSWAGERAIDHMMSLFRVMVVEDGAALARPLRLELRAKGLVVLEALITASPGYLSAEQLLGEGLGREGRPFRQDRGGYHRPAQAQAGTCFSFRSWTSPRALAFAGAQSADGRAGLLVRC